MRVSEIIVYLSGIISIHGDQVIEHVVINEDETADDLSFQLKNEKKGKEIIKLVSIGDL